MSAQEVRDLLVAKTMYDLMLLSANKRNQLFGVMHPVEIFENFTLSHIRRELGNGATGMARLPVADVMNTIDDVKADADIQGYGEYSAVMDELKWRIKTLGEIKGS